MKNTTETIKQKISKYLPVTPCSLRSLRLVIKTSSGVKHVISTSEPEVLIDQRSNVGAEFRAGVISRDYEIS